uniref:Transcriptional regulator n=1 Tax=Steinernema glaseri TaxID=37863 RepID=A0A1I8AS53_9BILA
MGCATDKVILLDFELSRVRKECIACALSIKVNTDTR